MPLPPARRTHAPLRAALPRLPRIALPLGAAVVLAAILALVPPRPEGFAPLLLSLAAAALAFERLAGPRCRTRRAREAAALSLSLVTAAIFFADLHAVVTLHKPQSFVTAGVVPLSDANGYVKGALNLIETGHLDEWSSRRPLAVAFLGLLLKLSGQSFRTALVLQTLVTWASLSVALREILLRLGLTAAVVFLAVAGGHHALYAGAFMTEPLGFSLGALGFALLLRGFADHDRRAALAGQLLFGVALAARTGPTPALLLLALYAARRFRGERRLDLRMLAAALAASLLPTLASALQLRVIGPPEHLMQGNISYALYRLAVGSSSWAQAVPDHPELYTITSDVQRSRMVYAFFWEAFRRQPSVFFTSLIRGWGQAIASPFGTVFDIGLPVARELFFLPAVLGALAIARAFLRRSRAGEGRGADHGDAFGFVAVVLAATFATYPILVDAWPRVLAASVCFHAAVAALGASAIARAAPPDPGPPHRGRLPAAGLALAAVVSILPLLFRIAHPDLSALTPPSCSAGEVPLAFRVARGSWPTVDAATRPQLQHAGLPALGDAKALPEGARFVTGLNLLDPKAVGSEYLVATNTPDETAEQGRVAFACARLLGTGRWWHRVYGGRFVR